MKQTIIFAVVVVIVLGGGIYFSRKMIKKNNDTGINQSNNQPINNTNTMPNENETAPLASVTLAGGLKIEDVKIGSGPMAKAGNTVTVNYTGTFADGKKFDSSYDRNQPFSFTLGAGQVIKGWDEGVAGMQMGGTRKLVVPSSMGYGPNDYGPIPGNSTLYFTVELLKIGS